MTRKTWESKSWHAPEFKVCQWATDPRGPLACATCLRRRFGSRWRIHDTSRRDTKNSTYVENLEHLEGGYSQVLGWFLPLFRQRWGEGRERWKRKEWKDWRERFQSGGRDQRRCHDDFQGEAARGWASLGQIGSQSGALRAENLGGSEGHCQNSGPQGLKAPLGLARGCWYRNMAKMTRTDVFAADHWQLDSYTIQLLFILFIYWYILWCFFTKTFHFISFHQVEEQLGGKAVDLLQMNASVEEVGARWTEKNQRETGKYGVWMKIDK